MTPLTQYGRMAESTGGNTARRWSAKWAEGILHQMLLEAENNTKDEMAMRFARS